MGTLFLIKEARIYNGGKTASSVNDVKKTGTTKKKQTKKNWDNYT